jgi:hypothetical protein
MDPALGNTIDNAEQLNKELGILKRAKESTRKKQEWFKLKTTKKFEEKEKEILALKE